eukprot:s1830_g19.t1
MDKPSWTSGYSKWDPSGKAAGGSNSSGSTKPITTFSAPSRLSEEYHREKRSRSANPPEIEARQPRLGKTEGAYAAGAWAAREEVASLLEAGVPAEEILAEIRSGQEGRHQLNEAAIPKVSTPRSRSPLGSVMSRGHSSDGRKSPPRSSNPGGRRNFEGVTFSKKARPPSEDDQLPESPGYSGSDFEEAEKAREDKCSGEPQNESSLVFRKRAKEPEGEPGPPPIPKEYENLRVPTRKDPRTADKYQAYDQRVLKLFEDLVILGVKMDLVGLVSKPDNPGIDERRFRQLTDPRSPDTGIRYANLMRRFLDFLSEEKFDPESGEEAISPENVGKIIEHLTASGVGFRTPQSFLYGLDYFSVLFGYQPPKIQFRRWKKLADDYAAKAPPRSGAPHFNVDFLGYLESVVLNEGYSLVERVTAGKLRLCIQTSIRHNDLLSTPLRMMEWCRFLGSEKAAGVRAKAPRTKSGVRPWVASFLGVCPAGDGWLEKTMELLLETHGPGWKTHEFCGCAPDGDTRFFKYPTSLGTDVEIVRSMTSRDIHSGKGPRMTAAEASSIRWYGAKATLTSFMVHFDIRTKYVRYQGGWKKASEAMPDLYLREAQTVVLKTQVQVLDLLRRGAALQLLEGRPLDYMTFEFPIQRSEEGAEQGWTFVKPLPPEVSREKAIIAMEATKAYDLGENGHLRSISNGCPSISSLMEEFRDLDPNDEDTESIMEEEASVELEVNSLLKDARSSEEGEYESSEILRHPHHSSAGSAVRIFDELQHHLRESKVFHTSWLAQSNEHIAGSSRPSFRQGQASRNSGRKCHRLV